MRYAPGASQVARSNSAAIVLVAVGALCLGCDDSDPDTPPVVLGSGECHATDIACYDQGPVDATVYGDSAMSPDDSTVGGIAPNLDAVVDVWELVADGTTGDQPFEGLSPRPRQPLITDIDPAGHKRLGETLRASRHPCLNDGEPLATPAPDRVWDEGTSPQTARWPEDVTYGYEGLGEPPPLDADCRTTVHQHFDGFDHVILVGDWLVSRPQDPFSQEISLRKQLVTALPPDVGGPAPPEPEWFEEGPMPCAAQCDVDPCPPCAPAGFWVSNGFSLVGAPTLTALDAASTVATEGLRTALSAVLAPRQALHRPDHPAAAEMPRVLVIVAVGQSEAERLLGGMASGNRAEAVLARLRELTEEIGDLVEALESLADSVGADVTQVLLVNPIDWHPQEGSDCRSREGEVNWSDDTPFGSLGEALASVWYRAAQAHNVDLVFAGEWATPHGFAGQEQRWVDEDGACIWPNLSGEAGLAGLIARAIISRDIQSPGRQP